MCGKIHQSMRGATLTGKLESSWDKKRTRPDPSTGVEKAGQSKLGKCNEPVLTRLSFSGVGDLGVVANASLANARPAD
jgi:hypothetical protein